jgi:DNA polymerase-3 subunit delta
MSQTIHAFDYLQKPADYPPTGMCVIFGDEPFLKRLVIRQLRGRVTDDEDVPYATFEGQTAEWRDVMDELSTVSLFGGGGRRLAVVDDGDRFVTAYRERLEEYLQRGARSGVLILDVVTWASNTRLYKMVDKSGLQIECRAPQTSRGRRKELDERRVLEWIGWRAEATHQCKLQAKAAQLLFELVGAEFGLLEQSLAKLALFTKPGGKVTPEMVQDIVGGWRTKTTWDMLEAACDGDTAEALRQLDHLLRSGENPLALFGSISWSLRRFADATRAFQRAEQQGGRPSMARALEQGGFRSWPQGAMERASRQLMQLGRHRAGQMYRWLLEADLALKGSHSSPAARQRYVLEMLVIRMSRQLASKPGAHR